jgi:hypothetical protein
MGCLCRTHREEPLARAYELPKWSPHLRAKITRDFSASDRAQNKGSRDPAP